MTTSKEHPKEKKMTWGGIYYKWIRKGYDQGSAAYMADLWMSRRKIKCQ